MPKTRTLWTVNPAVKFAHIPEPEAPAETAPTPAAQPAAPDPDQQARLVHESFETLRATLQSAQSHNDQQLAQTESSIEETNLKIQETQRALYQLEHTPQPAPQPAPPVVAPQTQVAPQPVAQPQLAPQPRAQAPTMNQPLAQPQVAVKPLAQTQMATPQPAPRPAAATAQGQPQAAPVQAQAAAAQAGTPMVAWGGQRPLRPQADIFVWPDESVSYLASMLDYFIRKGLSVMYYNPGFSYLPQDIIMLPFAPKPVPSRYTLVLDNNKRRTWEFLKQAFAARGIAL